MVSDGFLLPVRPLFGGLDGSWAQKLAVKANFCCSRDGRGRVVFDPFYFSLPPAEQAEWLGGKAAQGLTHGLLCRKYAYDRYTASTGLQPRQVPPDEFRQGIVDWFAAGLYPQVWLPFDDDADGQAAIYDGRMEAEARLLLPVVPLLGAVCPGWETPGAWTAKAIADLDKALAEK